MDVTQLSHCCGKRLRWTPSIDADGHIDGYAGRCSCGVEWAELATPARLLLPTEQMLLARIAELEEATRWRVTAEELPPVREWVNGWYGGSEPYEIVRYDGDQWDFRSIKDVNEPEHWQPIRQPGVS